MRNDPILDLPNINTYANFHQFALKILSRNDIPTSVNGHNFYNFLENDA